MSAVHPIRKTPPLILAGGEHIGVTRAFSMKSIVKMPCQICGEDSDLLVAAAAIKEGIAFAFLRAWCKKCSPFPKSDAETIKQEDELDPYRTPDELPTKRRR